MNEFDGIADRINYVKQLITDVCIRSGRDPDEINILPVSKNFDNRYIKSIIKFGFTSFGESRIQEIREKYKQFNKDIRWIMIGNLQTNKVKEAINYIDELESLDRLDLAFVLNKYLKSEKKSLKTLVQVKTSSEPQKYGLDPDKLIDFIIKVSEEYKFLEIVGLMTVAENSKDHRIIRNCFSLLRKLKEKVNEQKIPGVNLKKLSMGMSNDFEIAIEEGSTELRLGSILFGKRIYK
ncbi:type III pyridoxal 5-phosphate-dependent enzyme [Candidatus Kinetoplastibacterium oncopeltii TCC290E]|uniref:Pyridoxal phosphate homeostasis protein n=1 Tax=Candidatus Kinetoplastidibacterium stringomonadis TCC290E TaxID=1208920 RepID=M1LX19_9PROT|nr:YggS family pyridoxal phosphate-dependent enzyme [Candidatus Kinetoplastibacterium oncopeltii]AGF48621.1 type III pyridoxal 5-phosphate-dependent enzyme [Candidatus Kinetoplastibacterium oncopeltii TCC290E]